MTAPAGFSVATLPPSARDAIKAGQMKVNEAGAVQVYIEMNELSRDALTQLRSFGVTVQIVGRPKPDKTKGEVLATVPRVQAMLPIEMIDAVAALAFVRYIRLPDYGYTNMGSVQSQGDSLLNAESARQQFGVDGTGIRIGVISDGIGGIFATGCTTCGATSDVPSPMVTGDLPEATGTRDAGGVLTAVSDGIVATSFRADGDLAPASSHTASGVASEGTAMLEVIHDLAPGAQLYFANYDTSMSFQQAVDWIDQNTDVGVDDIAWLTPPFDGTSDVSTNTADELNTETNPVRGYFTSTGNFAFNHWGESWTDNGQNMGLSCPASQGGYTDPGNVQLFPATAKTNDASTLGPLAVNPFVLPSGATVTILLTWNDPYSGSDNDYDLFLYDFSSSTAVPARCSIALQSGTQPPLEALAYTNTSASSKTLAIFIQNYDNQAAARTFHMFVMGISNSENLNFYTPSGSVAAQSDAGGSPVSVVSVGATYAHTNTGGDPPATQIEPYSSQGPTQETPQAAARMKPDVTATDGVSVSGAGGFGAADVGNSQPCSLSNPSPPGCYFFGTSAASPHAGAVAGLVLQAAPCLLSTATTHTPAEARTKLRDFLTSTADPLAGVSDAVPNNTEGYGLLNALSAVTAAMPTADAGAGQTVNGASENGATVTLSGTGTDPNSCQLTYSWSGACGTATGANPSVTCPLGVNTETLTVGNGGATSGLSASDVQVVVSDFATSSSPASASVNAGQSASYTVQVDSKYGAYTDPVSLTCSGLPSRSSCSFSPSSVTPNSGSTTSTLTISTTAASSVFPLGGPGNPGQRLLVVWFGVFVLLSVLALVAKKSRRKVAFSVASCGLLICLVAFGASCGGNKGTSGGGGTTIPGTPAGTYSVTVTGSSNQLQHSTTISLTVQD